MPSVWPRSTLSSRGQAEADAKQVLTDLLQYGPTASTIAGRGNFRPLFRDRTSRQPTPP